MSKAKIVVGCNYGDEGKGTVAAYHAGLSTSALNVLTNGGAQRGHSIRTLMGDFTFHHFGSGTCFGADNYFSKTFILNPMLFVKEYEDLAKRIKIGPIFRNFDCRWTTPFDQMFNFSIEKARGDKNHGSCGMGIWETVRRHNNGVCMTFDNFMAIPHDLKVSFLKRIRTYFNSCNPYIIQDDLKDAWNSDTLIEHFINDCSFMYQHTQCVLDAIDFKDQYDDVIMENGQGLLLNDDPNNVHTTPSNTGLDDSISILNEMGIKASDTEIDFVTRPYMTRHGRGPFDTEISRSMLSNSVGIDRTNHYNEMQGDFRYGTLDIVDLKHRLDNECLKLPGVRVILNITHCDEMDRVADFMNYFNNIHTFDSPLV